MIKERPAVTPGAGYYDVNEHGFELLESAEVETSFVQNDLRTTTRACKLRAGWVVVAFVGFLQTERLWEWFS